MSDTAILATKVLTRLQQASLMLATAESCTGGLIAAAITDLNGASNVLDRGFITYSNEAKMEMLAVREQTLRDHGAVSSQTAAEMAAGALLHSRADIAVSVTGIAGPGGGTAEKPVGLVWFGIAVRDGEPRTVRKQFAGLGRAAVRRDSVATALGLVLEAAETIADQAGVP
ncbi:CinA family protein [Nitratireductor luteus]|uniref:CinA family protein n=1 Tax=Nitratireductor luteus TaxID=2976980 RepID=UPI00223EF41D|nr:CinA family protein [Nitratireductor luteus]